MKSGKNIYIYIGTRNACSYQFKIAQDTADKYWLYAVIWGLGVRAYKGFFGGFRV